MSEEIQRISPEEFAQTWRRQKHDDLFLDVRERFEWDEHHLEGFLHIPMNQVPAQLDCLARGKKIYVMCAHGMRSAQVTEYLQHQGYDDVVNIDGGIVAVQKALE